METKEEVQNAVPVEVKPKRERTEKQILSFEKARMVLLEKQKVKVKVEPPSDSSSEEEEEITVQKPKRAPKEPKTPRAPKEPQNEIIQPKAPRKPRVKKAETPMNSPVEPTNRNPYSAMLSKYRY